jgi:hypothetical protein
MKAPSPSMAAFQKRQADRAKGRIERDADIRASVKAGTTLATLGRKYQITMERVRQIGKQDRPLRKRIIPHPATASDTKIMLEVKGQ